MSEKKRTFVRKESYPDFQSFLMDTLPLQNQPIGWVNSFYFDTALTEQIAKDWNKYQMRAILGDKFTPLESFGMQVFLHLFQHETGISLENPEEYLPFIKKEEPKGWRWIDAQDVKIGMMTMRQGDIYRVSDISTSNGLIIVVADDFSNHLDKLPIKFASLPTGKVYISN